MVVLYMHILNTQQLHGHSVESMLEFRFVSSETAALLISDECRGSDFKSILSVSPISEARWPFSNLLQLLHVMSGTVLVTVWVCITLRTSVHAWGGKWKMIWTRNTFALAALRILATLLSSASVAPPTSSVFYPYEASADFQWGIIYSYSYMWWNCLWVEKGYAFEVIVHQMTNSFLVPSGKAGKDFVLELTIDYHFHLSRRVNVAVKI